MSTSKSTIFLTFTTLALAVTTGCLFRCYSEEKNEKIRQINENVQLQVRCADAGQQRDDALANIQQLNERNRQLSTIVNLRATTIQDLRNSIQTLTQENQRTGDNLGHLHQISDQLQELRGRLDRENVRDIAEELERLNQLDNERLTIEEQNRDYTVLELRTEMQDLRNSAIRIVIGQIRTEAQAREYQRQNEILREIINELVQKKPNIINFHQQANKISTAYDNHIDELFERIEQLSKQLNGK